MTGDEEKAVRYDRIGEAMRTLREYGLGPLNYEGPPRPTIEVLVTAANAVRRLPPLR